MEINLFISYSHKDETYREQLETQLSIMKRNNIVTAWSDRRIIPGQEWEGLIDANLNSAEVILLLVSPDFLSSDYCYENEMTRAIERHNEGEAVVVPIIVRPCDWHGTPFNKLQALPKEAKAVSKWGNEDEAWLSVVNELKKTVGFAKEKFSQAVVQQALCDVAIHVEFSKWLDDTEVELTHRRLHRVGLDDVYVVPDLKVLDNDMSHVSQSVGAEKITKIADCSLVVGDEQSGKTSLCKFYFKELLNGGWWPVIIQGENVKSSDITSLASNSWKQQYTESVGYNAAKNKVIIVDNFSSNTLNKKHQNKLIQWLRSEFEKVILLASDSYQYVVPEIEALDDFSHYEILGFGNVKRTELVEKWVSMGVVEEIDEAALYSEVDEIKLKVESLTRGNIIPSKPIFLLSLLQMFETLTPQKIDLTSYGHCYQYLIYQALEKVKVKNVDVDKYINFLTELGCAQFNNDGAGLDEYAVDEFYKGYAKKYISLSKGKVVDDLLDSGLLVFKNDLLTFRYPYIYYFFAAKKFAESFPNDDSIRVNIKGLLENLHREDCANIIIFITHHSKNEWVLDEIQMCLMELYSDYPEARLERESLEFMTEFLKEIPELVIEHRKVDEERKKHDSVMEEVENSALEEKKQNNELEPTDILAKINRTFKGIEIIGQIIRNRHGSLGKVKLEELAEQAYGVGLRFLEYFLEISDAAKEEVVKMIENGLKENPSITNEKLGKEAKNIFLLMTYGAIYGVLRKVSMSVGSKEAKQIYKRIEEKTPTPAVKLINQAIYLQFNKSLDAKSVKQLSEEFMKNPVCERLLKEIVIQHIYMYPVEYKEKQKIAEILNIPMADQMRLGFQKSFKV